MDLEALFKELVNDLVECIKDDDECFKELLKKFGDLLELDSDELTDYVLNIF